MLAIIPARGGSKGLPRKNVKLLHGRPMIEYAIEAARGARHVDRLIVSTEDDEIAEVARKAGAEVPFRRPPELASDQATVSAVCLHAIEQIAKEEGRPREAFVILQGNSPLMSSDDIDGTVSLFNAAKASAALTVRTADAPIEAVFEIDSDRRMRNALRQHYKVEPSVGRRQQYGPRVVISGAVIVAQTDRLHADANYFYSDLNVVGYLVPPERSIDIDTEFHFIVAEALLGRSKA